MTLAIFKTEGNCPVEKDILKISLNCCEMSFSSRFKILQECCLGQMICVNQERIL